MGDNKYKAEDAMQLNEAVERLQGIVDELKQGKLVLAGEGESILVEPEDAVKLEVEFERKKGKEELEIELSWKRAGAAEGEDEEGEDEEDEDEEEKDAMTEECAACPTHGEEHGHRHPLSRVLPLAALALTAAIIAIALKDGLPQWVLDLRDKFLKRSVEEEEELPRQEAEESGLPRWAAGRVDKLPWWALDKGEEVRKRVTALKGRKPFSPRV